MTKTIAGLAVIAAPLLLTGCGGSSGTPTASGSSTTAAPADDCAGKLTASADAKKAVPSDFPVIGDVTLTSTMKQGATVYVFGAVDETNLTGVRDELVEKIKDAGYTIKKTDQEAGAEAEAEFKGKGHEGSIQVIPLCAEHSRVRLKFES